MALLSPGDPFPRLSVPRVSSGRITLPDDLAGGFGVLLFYRGSWCPYCNAQLQAFQRSLDSLGEVGAKVTALSVDDEATTAALVAKLGLTFRVGYDADAQAISTATGAFVDPDRGFLQSTGFILDPTGNVVISVYSSGAIGRLVPDHVVEMLRYLAQHAASS